MSTYRDFAKVAKCRVIQNAGAETVLGAGFVNRTYSLNGKILSKEEIAEFAIKIIDMLRSGECNFAIGRLLEGLDGVNADMPEGQRVVLELSRLYCDVKDEYLGRTI